MNIDHALWKYGKMFFKELTTLKGKGYFRELSFSACGEQNCVLWHTRALYTTMHQHPWGRNTSLGILLLKSRFKNVFIPLKYVPLSEIKVKNKMCPSFLNVIYFFLPYPLHTIIKYKAVSIINVFSFYF